MNNETIISKLTIDESNLIPGIECYFQVYGILHKGIIIKKDDFIENNFLISSNDKNWSIPLSSIFLNEKEFKKSK